MRAYRTRTRERINNVMRGHDPVLYILYRIMNLFYFNAKFTAPPGLRREYHLLLYTRPPGGPHVNFFLFRCTIDKLFVYNIGVYKQCELV